MYSAESFQKDLLANLKSSKVFPDELVVALNNSEMEFQDSSVYTRRIWDTFTRILKIYCRTNDKEIIESYKRELYWFCDRLHGVRDSFMLMEIEVFIRATLDDTTVTRNEIVIKNEIIINKTDDYIAAGGFASIYKKTDPRTGIEYAFKIYDPSPFQGSDSEMMKKRFIREAKKLMSYAHENIVRAYDFGFLGDESAYIKLEYLDGDKVYDYIKNSLLSIEDKNRLARQYISAMAYIHSKADIHRDISYSNIMITKEGNVKVLDFGFSRNNKDTSYDTRFADILHKFNPPDSVYDVRTEVYCMGAVLFTIYTEQDFHISKLSEINNVDCSEIVKIAIKKCLEKNPEDRFQSAIELEDFFINSKKKLSFSKQDTNDFSLDEFNSAMSTITEIRFVEGGLPTFSTIKEWIENKLADILEKHRFLNQIDLVNLLIQIPNAIGITYLKSFRSIDKKLISNIYDTYRNFDAQNKNLLIKGLHTIIISKAVEVEDLPF